MEKRPHPDMLALWRERGTIDYNGHVNLVERKRENRLQRTCELVGRKGTVD